jgi:hypothetical protein
MNNPDCVALLQRALQIELSEARDEILARELAEQDYGAGGESDVDDELEIKKEQRTDPDYITSIPRSSSIGQQQQSTSEPRAHRRRYLSAPLIMYIIMYVQ